MLKTSELCIAEIPLRVRLGRICLELMTFMFMLIPSFLTLYFTDEMIEKGKSIPYAWVVFVILACVAIHVFQFYFSKVYEPGICESRCRRLPYGNCQKDFKMSGSGV